MRRLPLYLLAATTLLVLLGIAHLSTSSSPYSPASFFSGPTVAPLDDSSWEFDPDTDEHRAFCRSLSSKAEFVEALEQQRVRLQILLGCSSRPSTAWTRFALSAV